MTTPTPGPGPGFGAGKRISAALAVVADTAAVVGLIMQGIQPVLVVAFAVAGIAGVAGLLTPRKSFKAAGALLLAVGLIGGGVLTVNAVQGGDRSSAQASSPPSTRSESSSTPATSEVPRPTTASADDRASSSARTTSPSPGTTGLSPQAEGWYDLTAYRSVAFGNGHDSVNSIDIGTGPGAAAYPNSIRGYYSSSAADPNNRRTWLTGGKCTLLSVWVGKDAASSKSAGTGRFVVKAEDVERASAQASMSDSPQHMEVDITGVVRLTLLDTRGGQDANNAWGSPRVHCSAPPGKAN